MNTLITVQIFMISLLGRLRYDLIMADVKPVIL